MKGEEGRAVHARTKGWYAKVYRGLSRFVGVCGDRGGKSEETLRHMYTHTQTHRHRCRDRGKKEEGGEKGKRKCRRAGGCSQPAVPSAADRFIEWHVPIRSNVVLCLPLSYPGRARSALPDAKIIIALCFTLQTFALSPDF